jgi:hypothetical protein
VAALAGFAGWRWLITRSQEDGLPWPRRRMLEFNERLARGIHRASRRAPEFPRSAARMPRVNGSIGLGSNLDPARWRLQVVGAAGAQARRSFTLDDVKALPRVEMTTDLRCFEGWSEVIAPGDGRCAAGREERDQLRDFIGTAERNPAERIHQPHPRGRRVRARFGRQPLNQRHGSLGLGVPGGDRVHADAEGAHLLREPLL